MQRDYSAIRELRPYLADPPAMAAGGAGKCGALRLHFERDAGGLTHLRGWEQHAPLIAQQPLYFDEQLPTMACLYILSAGGPQVDGDRYQTEVRVGCNAELFLSTGAATKVASMRHNFAAVEQHFTLDDGAYMEYLPEPTIPSRASRLWSHTRLTVAPTATLFYSECYLSGRRYHLGERFAYDLLSLSLGVERPTGEALFREKILLEPHRFKPAQRGVLGPYDHFGTALILTPSGHSERLLQRLGPKVGFHDDCALGLLCLPNRAGLQCRILSHRSEPIKQLLRHLCSLTRQAVKGVAMPEKFAWR